MNTRGFYLSLVLLFAMVNANAQIYKWVDEKGVTHYGQKPPENTKSTEVKISTPDEATLAAASERLAKIREDLLNRNAKNNLGIATGQAVSPNAARCAELRQQSAALNSRLADVPPAVANEARARVAAELEAACRSGPVNDANKEAQCNAALQALLGMENPQSRATASEREVMRNRARASCQ